MIISHNLEAINSMRNSQTIGKLLTKSSEKLSTGYKINRSADNAAGLQISEKMRAQIRGLEQASTNAQDGISFIQTIDGALDNVQALIQRGRELSVQAANDTNVESDRLALQEEINNINNEITRIGKQTQFNTINCFPTTGISPTMIHTIQDPAVYNILIKPSSGSAVVSVSSSSTGNALYDKIATELIPNAVNQILTAFPSLSTGDADIPLKLDIGNIDEKGNKLAYAQISYYPSTGDIISFTLKVDSSDFNDADAAGTGTNAEMLESTIAHEMMHHIMYKALTDGMTAYGTHDFPNWFVEGTAQVVGGGFTTGWNNTLSNIESSGLNETDKKTAVIDYLNDYTPASRPYGHGYLATAYLGHLASGTPNSAVTPDSIRAGLNTIFSSIRAGNTLEQTIKDNTSYQNAEAINSAFANPDTILLDVVRTLAKSGGAGSVITTDFSIGGTNILDDSTSPLNVMFVLSDATIPVPPGAATNTSYINLQIGANSKQSIGLKMYDISTPNLGIDGVSVIDHSSASSSIEKYTQASLKISSVRSYYGAMQNRLEHTISNLNNSAENLQAAESRIRDTDFAKEMVSYSKYNILQQVTHSILAQANQSKQGVLSLLQ